MKKELGIKTYVFPQPVLVIGTYDEKGKPDLMTAAWGGIAGNDKLMVHLSNKHQTTINIRSGGEFTVNIGVREYLTACDYVGIVSQVNEPQKVEKSGFTLEKAPNVNAPAVNELPICLECRTVSISDDGLILAQIINVCAEESILAEDGKPDISKFAPITYDPAHNKYAVIGEIVGNAFADGGTLK